MGVAAIDGDGGANSEVESYLEKMKPAWAAMEKALSMRRWQSTPGNWMLEHGEDAESYLALPRTELALLSQGWAVDAKRLFLVGKEDEAVEKTLQLVTLGNKLQDSEGALVDFINGISIENLGYSMRQL